MELPPRWDFGPARRPSALFRLRKVGVPIARFGKPWDVLPSDQGERRLRFGRANGADLPPANILSVYVRAGGHLGGWSSRATRLCSHRHTRDEAAARRDRRGVITRASSDCDLWLFAERSRTRLRLRPRWRSRAAELAITKRTRRMTRTRCGAPPSRHAARRGRASTSDRSGNCVRSRRPTRGKCRHRAVRHLTAFANRFEMTPGTCREGWRAKLLVVGGSAWRSAWRLAWRGVCGGF